MATIHGATSLATEIAMLEVSADDASYTAEGKIRDAERAAQRELERRQISELREKASTMRRHALVDGGLQLASAAGTATAAFAQYKADVAKIAGCENPTAVRNATLCGGGAKLMDGGTKVSDLAFGSVETDHETASLEWSHEADAAKDRAERASRAAQRVETESDQKLGIVQEMLRSDADLVHTLITRS